MSENQNRELELTENNLLLSPKGEHRAKELLLKNLSSQLKPMKIHMSDVINHPSGDGANMQEAIENIVEPNNIEILSKEEFIEKLIAGQIDYSCIDGRSVTEPNKTVVHVAGDAYGLHVLAPMQMLADLGVSHRIDDDMVEQFLTENNIKPTSHSGSHSEGDDSITTCDCGHCKTNGMELDEDLMAIANKHYENPVQLVGDHKEQAIIVSPSKDTLVLVKTTNELLPGDKSTQAEHQVFWNDAGAIEVIIEHYADSFARIISQVGNTFSPQQVATARNEAYNMQLNKTVAALLSSRPLKKAGKIFTITADNMTRELSINQVG